MKRLDQQRKSYVPPALSGKDNMPRYSTSKKGRWSFPVKIRLSGDECVESLLDAYEIEPTRVRESFLSFQQIIKLTDSLLAVTVSE